MCNRGCRDVASHRIDILKHESFADSSGKWRTPAQIPPELPIDILYIYIFIDFIDRFFINGRWVSTDGRHRRCRAQASTRSLKILCDANGMWGCEFGMHEFFAVVSDGG